MFLKVNTVLIFTEEFTRVELVKMSSRIKTKGGKYSRGI